MICTTPLPTKPLQMTFAAQMVSQNQCSEWWKEAEEGFPGSTLALCRAPDVWADEHPGVMRRLLPAAAPASGSSPWSLSLCRLLCCVCVKRWACAAHFPASGCLYLPCSMSHRRTIYILVFSTFRNLGKAMSPVPLHCRSWYFSLVREM